MEKFSVAFFSDPPVSLWGVPELLKQKIPVSSAVTVLPRFTRTDAGDELKKICESRGVAYFRPTSLSSPDFVEAFRKTSPSVIAAMSFLNKVPKAVLDVPPLGGINAHPSLLPRYRGAIPYFWILYHREGKSGITVHDMNGEFDAGDIYLQEEVPVTSDETTGTLAVRCYAVGLRMLITLLRRMMEGEKLPRKPQNPAGATYAPLPDASILEIDWGKPAGEILALVRASSPFLGAFTLFRQLQLKVWSAKLSRPNAEKAKPGTMAFSQGKLEVAAADHFISLEVLQLEMLRYYSAAEFMAIPGLKSGEILGRAR